jgi:hypothetical protein
VVIGVILLAVYFIFIEEPAKKEKSDTVNVKQSDTSESEENKDEQA